MTKHIILDVPEEDDAECALAELKDAIKQYVDRCPCPGCTVCPLIEELATSARLVEVEKRHPEMDDHLCANHRQGCVACERGTGYNAAIDEILGGK